MIQAMNNHVFVEPIKETKQVGGLDLISKYDEEDRYCKATVIYVDDTLPLSSGNVILYDKNNGHDFQDDDGKLLRVLHARDVVGCVK